MFVCGNLYSYRVVWVPLIKVFDCILEQVLFLSEKRVRLDTMKRVKRTWRNKVSIIYSCVQLRRKNFIIILMICFDSVPRGDMVVLICYI